MNLAQICLKRLVVVIGALGLSLGAESVLSQDRETGVELANDVRIVRETDRVLLTMTVSGARAGSRVCLSDYHWGEDANRVKFLGYEEGDATHLLPDKPLDGGACELTVVFPIDSASGQTPLAIDDGPTDPSPSWRLLYVENEDGSRSRVLRWRADDRLLENVDQFAGALPAQTDERVSAPNVEGYSLDRAAIELFDRGLIAVPVHSDSLRLLPSSDFTAEWVKKQTVVRQGAAPGQTLRRNQIVLLTIRDPSRPSDRLEWPPSQTADFSSATAGDEANNGPDDGGPPPDAASAPPASPPDVQGAAGGLKGNRDGDSARRLPGGLSESPNGDDPANPKGPRGNGPKGNGSNNSGPKDNGPPPQQPGIDITPGAPGDGPEGGLNGTVNGDPSSKTPGGLVENPDGPTPPSGISSNSGANGAGGSSG